MLVNREMPEVQQLLEDPAASPNSGLAPTGAFCKHPDPFELLPDASGFEFAELIPVTADPIARSSSCSEFRTGRWPKRELKPHPVGGGAYRCPSGAHSVAG